MLRFQGLFRGGEVGGWVAAVAVGGTLFVSLLEFREEIAGSVVGRGRRRGGGGEVGGFRWGKREEEGE